MQDMGVKAKKEVGSEQLYPTLAGLSLPITSSCHNSRSVWDKTCPSAYAWYSTGAFQPLLLPEKWYFVIEMHQFALAFLHFAEI